jgi:hypothetical protein
LEDLQPPFVVNGRTLLIPFTSCHLLPFLQRPCVPSATTKSSKPLPKRNLKRKSIATSFKMRKTSGSKLVGWMLCSKVVSWMPTMEQ